MAGVSTKAMGIVDNNEKYNGYEFNYAFDINLYESFYRSHDPQIGRFLQLDPKPIVEESQYVAMGNNPILHFDILGDTLDIGRNSQSEKDIYSVVDKENRQYININEGRVSIADLSNLSESVLSQLMSDEGFMLIAAIANAPEKFYYDASEIFLAKNEMGTTIGGFTNVSTHGIINASNNGLDSEDKHAIRPRNGYDGQVVINPFVELEEVNSGDNGWRTKERSSIVFHEIAENFERTSKGINYNSSASNKGAHQLALDREKRWKNGSNTSRPGEIRVGDRPIPRGRARRNYTRIINNYINSN